MTPPPPSEMGTRGRCFCLYRIRNAALKTAVNLTKFFESAQAFEMTLRMIQACVYKGREHRLHFY